MVSAPATTPSSDLSTQSSALSTLPALTPSDSHLLHTFLILRYDMVALAEQEKLHPAQLLAFAHSPAIQAHLAALKTFADQAYALRSLESRIEAINALESITKTTDNPIEKRRAASAILRGLNPGTPTLRGGSRSNSPSLREGTGGGFSSPPSNSPSPRSAGSSRAAAADATAPSTHPPHSRDANSTLTASDHHRPSPPHSSPTPRPLIPLPTPSPSLTPQEVAHKAMMLCNRRHLPDHIAALEAFLAAGATFNHEPVLSTATQAPLFHPNGAISTLPVGPQSETTAQVRLTSPNPPHFLFTLTRSQTGPHPSSWLIAEIHEDTS